jgi:hypothetical protein
MAGRTADDYGMLRRCEACVALLALLAGFAAAPYTHAHHVIDAPGDAHHPRTQLHTHATPHAPHRHDAEPPPSETPDEDERIWSVATFVAHQPLPLQAGAPVILPRRHLHVELSRVWFVPHRLTPAAHGPPVVFPRSLRAPPAFLPLFS